jgi:hypothetical protein
MTTEATIESMTDADLLAATGFLAKRQEWNRERCLVAWAARAEVLRGSTDDAVWLRAHYGREGTAAEAAHVARVGREIAVPASQRAKWAAVLQR